MSVLLVLQGYCSGDFVLWCLPLFFVFFFLGGLLYGELGLGVLFCEDVGTSFLLGVDFLEEVAAVLAS